MSRVMAALLGCWLSLGILYNGTGVAMATQHTPHAVVLLASNDAEDEQTGLGTWFRTKKAPEKTVKKPARQVPVEPFDEPGEELEKPSGSSAEKKEADEPGAEPDKKALKKTPEKSTGTPAAKAREEKPEKKTRDVHAGSSADEAGLTVPVLPIRKPRKPVFHKKKEPKKAGVKPALPRSARDKKLCKSLQMCRNKFVKCKSKIKHPDQSEPWIIAKEICGGYYKTCVEKDFQPGEWFMTRWFYFQELNCGK